ncbi:MAG TPA: 2-dehydropantoate 2-reductase [Steroidobacteraceae bacterium]|nr:2-dehydropantoate 2-reductase [Steroidobacteraceae bacterium]
MLTSRNRPGSAAAPEAASSAAAPAAQSQGAPLEAVTQPRLRFVILGAGALGSIIAAHLTRAGHPVSLLARGRRAALIQEQGLRIRGLVHLDQRVTVIDDPARCPDADALIVCTKAQGTLGALEPLRHARFDAVLSVQNGVLKNELLARVFGHERVLGALADSSGELKADGEVLFTRNECIALGELEETSGQRAARIAAALAGAGVGSRAVADIASLEWCKFVAWVALMVLSVTTRAYTGAFLDDPEGALLLVHLVREMGTLAVASGALLTDEVTLPVAALCARPESEAVEIVRAGGRALMARAPMHRMSSLQDLAAGRALELEETIGDAVRRADALELSLPLLRASHLLVTAIDRLSARSRL